VTVCPVCEHAQEHGAECEVCGKSLRALGGVDLPVALLDGLEPTALGGPVEVSATPIAELEPTAAAPVAAPPSSPFQDLQPTAMERVEATGEPVPDMEQTALPASADARTELPLFPICRYCRTEAGPGEMRCNRCGMRLTGLAPPRPATIEAVRYCSCGTPVTRSTCPACGARNSTSP
jgi:hypothetical protein